MRLRTVGFFRELGHGEPDGPSLRDAVSDSPPQDREHIAGYLRSGNVFAVTGGMGVDDVLDRERTHVAELMTLTDGEWVWPSDLVHYFEEYNVALPEDFVDHMRALNWTPPALSHDGLVALTDEVFGERDTQ